MSRNRFWWSVLAVLVVAAMILVACGRTTPTAAPSVETTEAPRSTAVSPTPTPQPRLGAWVDEVVVSTFDQEQAMARLKAGEVDLYADTLVAPDVHNVILDDPNLATAQTVTGRSVDIMVNPVPFSDGWNPFSDQRIREALNYLLNREYAAKEIHAGWAYPKYTALSVNLPEYVNIIDTMKALEAKYHYNPQKGKAIIAERMQALGAERDEDGKWVKDGKPVVIHFIIRTDLWKNREIGDMFADALEEAGFTVDRMYRTYDEARALVFQSDPAEGRWHLYTGGWRAGGLARDEFWVWGLYYTNLYYTYPLWQAYEVPEKALGWAQALWNGDFESIAERTDLMRKCAAFFTSWSTHLFVVELSGFQPYRQGIQVAYDLAAGIGSSDLWPYTLRWKDRVGGVIRFGQKTLFVDPWNPVEGGHGAYDLAIQAATNDKGAFLDPYTGLNRPQRIEKAEVVVKTGTPVTRTYDWVDLRFADTIEVPGDAWVDWDAVNQRWITADEMTQRVNEAKAKVDAAKTKASELVGTVDLEALDPATVQQFLSDLVVAYGLSVDVTAYFEDEEAARTLAQTVEKIKGADDPAKALVDYGLDFLSQQDPDTFDWANRDYTTARMKSVVYYPEGMFDLIKWHDGSNLSLADFVYNMILLFDRGKEASPLYDETAASQLVSFLNHFKGVRIVSTDPLVIETYDDSVVTLDAENLVITWWPQNAQAWHVLAIAAAAEANGELAFSSHKADAMGVEWTDFVAGPSLDILKKYLDEAAVNNTIPYEHVLKDDITVDEAEARYANLSRFYGTYGHFWIGTGPFVLTDVDTTNKMAVLKRFEEYPDPADKWAIFGTPMLAEVEINGVAQVVKGQEAAFDVFVTFNGDPYPADQMAKVIYLVFDEAGNLQTKGEAVMVEEGTYRVMLPGEVTKGFATGALNLQVAAVPKAVAVSGVGSFDFVAVEP